MGSISSKPIVPQRTYLSTSSICISSSFSGSASPLSGCCKRDFRSGGGNTTVGLMKYSDIGGLRIDQYSIPSTRDTTYIKIEFAAFVRLDIVATCGSTEGKFVLSTNAVTRTGILHL